MNHCFTKTVILFCVTAAIGVDEVAAQDLPTLPGTPFPYADTTNWPAYYTNPNVGGTAVTSDNQPANNVLTDHGATLGRVLFYDRRLSFNDTISCGSCHQQQQGFSDAETLSMGFDGGFTGRNSMSLANVRYYANGRMMWDERHATLEVQALQPIQDAVEMGWDGSPGKTLADLEAKLAATSYYPALFANAFGSSNVTANRIARAIAQFERAMVSYESEFDQGTFTQQEADGERMFRNQPGGPNNVPGLNCSRCHSTRAHTLGGAPPVGAPPNAPTGPFAANIGLDRNTNADQGAGNGRFKTASLRNIEVSGPYMHDGRFESLEEVVEFYNSGVQNHPNLHPILRAGPNGPPQRLNLSQYEKDALVAFLKTLTDPMFLMDPKFSDPFPVRRPEVATTQVGDDSSHRTSVESITLKMDGAIVIDPGAFTVVQVSDRNGITGATVDSSFTWSVIDGQTVVVITFNAMTRNAVGALMDGNYLIQVDNESVRRDGLPMSNDFIFGDDMGHNFFAFYGDSDGDRDVDADDLVAFSATYRLDSSDPGFDAKFDYDADGDVDAEELNEFSLRFRTSLTTAGLNEGAGDPPGGSQGSGDADGFIQPVDALPGSTEFDESESSTQPSANTANDSAAGTDYQSESNDNEFDYSSDEFSDSEYLPADESDVDNFDDDYTLYDDLGFE